MFSPGAPEPFDEAFMQVLSDDLEKEAAHLGLYLAGMTVQVPAVDPEEAQDFPQEALRPFMLLTFQVGAVAFTERVQDPEADAVSDEVRALESEYSHSEFEAFKRRLRDQQGDDPLWGLS